MGPAPPSTGSGDRPSPSGRTRPGPAGPQPTAHLLLRRWGRSGAPPAPGDQDANHQGPQRRLCCWVGAQPRAPVPLNAFVPLNTPILLRTPIHPGTSVLVSPSQLGRVWRAARVWLWVSLAGVGEWAGAQREMLPTWGCTTGSPQTLCGPNTAMEWGPRAQLRHHTESLDRGPAAATTLRRNTSQ